MFKKYGIRNESIRKNKARERAIFKAELDVVLNLARLQVSILRYNLVKNLPVNPLSTLGDVVKPVGKDSPVIAPADLECIRKAIKNGTLKTQ